MAHILVFPGQGSQSVGMGKELAENFREFSLTLEEASDTLKINMQELLFEDPKAQLNLTEYTQPAILTVSTGILRILRERAGITPTLVAGHSLGEYSALVALGALSFTDAVAAVRFRGQAMQRAVPVGVGAMAAYIGGQAETVINLCKDMSTPSAVVEAVNLNSPTQIVLSGHKAAVENMIAVISERKLGKAKLLPVSAPFHSSLMMPAAEEMAKYLENIPLHSFSGTLVANVDAQAYTHPNYTKNHLVRQIASPVRWTESLHTLQRLAPDASWIEVGPGNVLQGLIKATLSIPCAATGTKDNLAALLP